MRIPPASGARAAAAKVSVPTSQPLLPPLGSSVPVSQPMRCDASSISMRRSRTPSADVKANRQSTSDVTADAAAVPTAVSDASRRLENGSVRVVARCRPMNAVELARGDAHLFRFSSKESREMQVISAAGATRELVRSFQFDFCASDELSQSSFFRASGAMALMDAVVDGYFATIFAYGQTGSGKTYSMSGIDELLANAHRRSQAAPTSSSPLRHSDDAHRVEPSDGIIPRALKYLFRAFEAAPKDVTFVVRASFCEIYNEQVFDLLHPASGALSVRWTDRSGFYVQDLLVVTCDSIDDVLAVVHEGHRNRRVGTHAMNTDSSRSHSILSVHVDRQTTDPNDGHVVTTFGKVAFVDLAGSERLKETKSVNTEETSKINTSLLTLGKVISALATRTSARFVPYRDSNLTKLLMDSLGGNSLTLMIACVSPSAAALEDTLSTLSYATRAKNIQNRPTIQVDAMELALSSLRKENNALRAENDALRLQLRTLGNVAAASTSGMRASVSKSSLLSMADARAERDASRLHAVSESLPRVLPLIHASRSPDKDHYSRQQQQQQSTLSSSTTNNHNIVETYKNQMQSLQDENDKLVQRARAAEQSAQQLRAANHALEVQMQQLTSAPSLRRYRADSPTKAAAMQQNSSASSAAAVDTLRQQVQQLQQREQELMQALARRSRGNREAQQ